MVAARFTTDSQGFFRRRLPPSSPTSFSIVSLSYPSLLCLCVPSPLASTQPIPLYRLRRTGMSKHQVVDAHLPVLSCVEAWRATHVLPHLALTIHWSCEDKIYMLDFGTHRPIGPVFLILDSMKRCKKQKNHAKTISFGRMSKFKANRTYVFHGPRVALVLVGLVHR
jgi:hypothetical protein